MSLGLGFGLYLFFGFIASLICQVYLADDQSVDLSMLVLLFWPAVLIVSTAILFKTVLKSIRFIRPASVGHSGEVMAWAKNTSSAYRPVMGADLSSVFKGCKSKKKYW